MMNLVFYCGVGAITFCEIGLLASDVAVPVSPSMSLYSSPIATNEYVLSSTRGRLVSGILTYAILSDGTIAGTTVDGFFVVFATEEVREYKKRSDWLTALSASDIPQCKPSHWDDPTFWRMQISLAMGLLLWVTLAYLIRKYIAVDTGASRIIE